jgi:uncharacterized Zn finger protein
VLYLATDISHEYREAIVRFDSDEYFVVTACMACNTVHMRPVTAQDAFRLPVISNVDGLDIESAQPIAA